MTLIDGYEQHDGDFDDANICVIGCNTVKPNTAFAFCFSMNP